MSRYQVTVEINVFIVSYVFIICSLVMILKGVVKDSMVFIF